MTNLRHAESEVKVISSMVCPEGCCCSGCRSLGLKAGLVTKLWGLLVKRANRNLEKGGTLQWR